jgi:PLP dependent protein
VSSTSGSVPAPRSVPSVEEVRTRLHEVRTRIERAGGDPELVTICAVTKGFDVEVARVAIEAGLVDLGENYAQELVAKADALSVTHPDARWHMIGSLQRNKVRRLAPHVHCWQTVDRGALGEEIAARAPGAQVLLQVNVTDEAGKGGISPSEVPELADRLRTLGLDLRGLMAVGPTDAGVDPKPGFDLVRRLADQLGLPVRSMGMTRDLEAAIAAGATMVRVGTALFGSRPAGATVN